MKNSAGKRKKNKQVNQGSLTKIYSIAIIQVSVTKTHALYREQQQQQNFTQNDRKKMVNISYCRGILLHCKMKLHYSIRYIKSHGWISNLR